MSAIIATITRIPSQKHVRSPPVRPGDGHDVSRLVVVSTPDQGQRTIHRSRGCRGQGGIDHTRGAAGLPLLAAAVVRVSWV